MGFEFADIVDKLLSKASLRKTRPRRTVLSELLKTNRPMRVEQIASAIGAGKVNKVTIYRVLASFMEANIVHKAFLKGRSWYFELAHNCSEHQCHPHFTCTKCARIHCMTGMKVPKLKDYKGFKIIHQKVSLKGICPECLARKL